MPPLTQKTVQRLSMTLFFASLLWTTYVTVSYFGIPVHGAVLLPSGAEAKIAAACESNGVLCRGFGALIPSVSHSIARMSPILAYALISLSLYFVFLGWRAFATGRFALSFLCKPYQVYLLFLFSLWLFFTTLASSSMTQGNGTVAFSRVIEPHPDVYSNIEPGGLQALREYFEQLEDEGCLIYRRDIRPDIREFDMRGSCMQQFFFVRVLSQVIFLSMLLLAMMTLGRAVLSGIGVRSRTVGTEAVLSFGLGACIWIVLLWTLAVAALYTQKAGWAAIGITFIALYRHARYWLVTFFTHRKRVECAWYGLTVLCAGLLISYLAFNFLSVIRPFPIGWDDLGSYLNRPKQLVSFGSFMYFMSSFQWEYLTSMAYLLYGIDSVFGSTGAMMINWMAGLLAVLSIIVFGNTFLGAGAGLLAALAYYALPMVGHFSFADMKTDNAVFAFQALSLLCLFYAVFGSHDEQDDEESEHLAIHRWRYVLLSGLFCGFAFGTKATAVMVLMALLMTVAGTLSHPVASLGIVAFSIIVFIANGALSVADAAGRIGFESVSNTFAMAFAAAAGLACFGYAVFVRPNAVRRTIVTAAVLLTGFGFAVLPWILHNNILRGNLVPRLELSAPNTVTPYFDTDGERADQATVEGRVVRALPAELRVDKSHAACQSSSREEELGRYWGSRTGWKHYLTLPWRTTMNIDSAGYYVTTAPALLFLPLLLLMPFFWRRESRWLRWLFAATAFMTVQWMFMANGVVWYGIGMFLGLCIAQEVLLRKAPDVPNKAIISLALFLSLLSCFAMRFWQFEQQRNMLDYPMGKSSAATLRERTVPYYDDIAKMVVDRHESQSDRPYMYRVGTFIPYFVPRNLEIIAVNDHQLDFFNCLYQERDGAKTLARLKALGFNSIIFDTNTATIEKDPNGTLHKKVQSFVDFLNDTSIGLQLVFNKPSAGVVFLLIP